MFWETILGNRLANVLIQELPKLTEPKEQVTVEVHDQEELLKKMEEMKQKEYRYHSFIPLDEKSKLLVFEK